MAWTTPRTWVAGEVVTAALMNTHLRDNLDALRTGGIALASQAAQDFIYASSATQLARLAAAAGKSPRYSGSAWAMVTPAKAVYGSTSTSATSTSTSYADTNLAVSITPQSTLSVIVILVAQFVQGANGDQQTIALDINGATITTLYDKTYSASDGGITWQYTGLYRYAPASVSALTIKTQQKRTAGSGSGVVCQPGSTVSRIIAVEVEA